MLAGLLACWLACLLACWLAWPAPLPSRSQKRNADGSWEYGVSNVEYTEFDRIGFSDAADETSPSTSRFPANTNILYVDLSAVQGALRAVPESALPGMIFNRKKKVSFRDAADGGRQKSVKAGRIESTMQNLADHLVERFGGPLSPDAFGGLHTFVVYNERRRTTSSAKRQRKAGDKHLHQTPDGSFLDLMRNGRDLLIRAGWEVPDVGAEEDYLARGPSMVFLFHPGLGPLWDVAAQKLGSGVLREGSEMVVECAEVRGRTWWWSAYRVVE